MKKLIVVLALATILATGTAFADHPDGWGIGLITGFHGGWVGETAAGVPIGLSLKIPNIPVFWGLSFGFGSEFFDTRIMGDYYIFDSPLGEDLNLHWFLGVGGFFDIFRFSRSYFFLGKYSYTSVAFGARLPVGLSWQPKNFLELFLGITPGLGINIRGSGRVEKSGATFAVFWPIELGVRLWIPDKLSL